MMVPGPALRAVAEERRRPPEDVWEDELRRLEGIGAELESERPGEAFFAVDGLLGLYGGERSGVVRAARRAARLPVRIGVAPTRFAAFDRGGRRGEARSRPAAAARVPRPAAGRLADPAPRPRRAARASDLVETMGRLGIATLGALAALAPGRVADRFGPPGLRALRLARGEEEPLRPRRPPEELAAEIELPEGIAGGRLERALELLVDRFLSAPQRRGRTVLALRLGALLGDGGSWSAEQGLGRPTASAPVLRRLLGPRLESLPAPATLLRLRALCPRPARPAISSSSRSAGRRIAAVASATRCARCARPSGAEALLKVLPVEPASRVPERRAVLTPYRP